MKPCPRCGTANEDAGAACTACGAPFVAGPNPMKQTMLGVAGPTPRGLAPAPAAPAGQSARSAAPANAAAAGVPMSTMQSAYAPTEAVAAYTGHLQAGPPTPRGMAPPAAAAAQGGYVPPAAAGAAFKQTMVGGVATPSVAPHPAHASLAAAPPGKLPNLAGTMLGMAGPQPGSPPEWAAPASHGPPPGQAPPAHSNLPNLKGTMLGMAGPSAAPTAAPGPGWSAQQPHEQAPPGPAVAAAPMGATQVLHGAPMAPSPTPAMGATQVFHGAGRAQENPGWGNPPPAHDVAVAGAPPWAGQSARRAATANETGSVPPALNTLPSTGVTGPSVAGAAHSGGLPGVPTAGAPVSQVPKSTMLGVAIPGIAPLNPGVAKEGPPTAPPQRPAAPVAPVQVPAVKAGIPKGALVLMAVAGVLTVTAVVVALLWQAPRPIYAAPVLGKSGTEVLELSCENCPDGTRVSSGGGSATFETSKARLPLERPLTVGDNRIDVSIERPGMGRDEKLTLAVPIAFRVRGDLTALREEPPRLKVVVEAVRGTAVVIDGQAVPLDTAGRAERALDVSKDLRGMSEKVESLSRTIPYTVQPPNAPAQTGSVSLRVGVVPLRIDAPGPSIIVQDEHFMLTGRTLKRGEVKVAQSHITVAPDGRFSQLMNVSSEGETTITIRADADNHAPRTALVKVKRVASLEKEATAFSHNATDEYSRYGTDADSKPGLAVVVRGRILESRVDNHTTLALAEVTKGCNEEPCVARLVLGRTLDLAKGDVIRAFGTVQRAVEGPRSGQRIPEVAVEFMLKGATP